LGHYNGHILVPFCVESALSGVKKTVTDKDRIWYRRTFDIPAGCAGRRILLHFGAVDWEATVWINGRQATHHRGGYDPFGVDITDMLTASWPSHTSTARSTCPLSSSGKRRRALSCLLPPASVTESCPKADSTCSAFGNRTVGHANRLYCVVNQLCPGPSSARPIPIKATVEETKFTLE